MDWRSTRQVDSAWEPPRKPRETAGEVHDGTHRRSPRERDLTTVPRWVLVHRGIVGTWVGTTPRRPLCQDPRTGPVPADTPTRPPPHRERTRWWVGPDLWSGVFGTECRVRCDPVQNWCHRPAPSSLTDHGRLGAGPELPVVVRRSGGLLRGGGTVYLGRHSLCPGSPFPLPTPVAGRRDVGRRGRRTTRWWSPAPIRGPDIDEVFPGDTRGPTVRNLHSLRRVRGW